MQLPYVEFTPHVGCCISSSKAPAGNLGAHSNPCLYFTTENKAQREIMTWPRSHHNLAAGTIQIVRSPSSWSRVLTAILFFHLACQKVSQSSFNRPGLPHKLLEETSGLLTSREPFSLLLWALMSCPLQRHLVYIFAPWDLASGSGRTETYTVTCSKPKLPVCIIKLSVGALGQWPLLRNARVLGRLVAGWDPGRLHSEGEASGRCWEAGECRHPSWCHLGAIVLWKHLQPNLSWLILSAKRQIASLLLFSPLSMVQWQPLDPLLGSLHGQILPIIQISFKCYSDILQASL